MSKWSSGIEYFVAVVTVAFSKMLFFLLTFSKDYFVCMVLCPMSESWSGKREGFQDNATCKKKGSLLLTRVRAPATTNAVV